MYSQVTLNTPLSELSKIFDRDPFVLVVASQKCFSSTGKATEKKVITGVATRIDLLKFILEKSGTNSTPSTPHIKDSQSKWNCVFEHSKIFTFQLLIQFKISSFNKCYLNSLDCHKKITWFKSVRVDSSLFFQLNHLFLDYTQPKQEKRTTVWFCNWFVSLTFHKVSFRFFSVSTTQNHSLPSQSKFLCLRFSIFLFSIHDLSETEHDLSFWQW